MHRLALLVLLALGSGAAAAYAPCPIATNDCSRVTTRLVVETTHAFETDGDAGGQLLIGSEYGEVQSSPPIRNGFTYSKALRGRASESISATALAYGGPVFAEAEAAGDLGMRTLRARIDGRESDSPVQALFESSFAEVLVVVQDTIYVRQAPGAGPPTLTVAYTVEGEIGQPRGREPSRSFVQASVSLGGVGQSRTWTDAGSFVELLTDTVQVPMVPSGFELPYGLTLSLRLDSGAGAGAYAIDLMNTARFELRGSPGLTWRSESGLLSSPVPEPTTAGLFAAGLLGLAALRRATSHRPARARAGTITGG